MDGLFFLRYRFLDFISEKTHLKFRSITVRLHSTRCFSSSLASSLKSFLLLLFLSLKFFNNGGKNCFFIYIHFYKSPQFSPENLGGLTVDLILYRIYFIGRERPLITAVYDAVGVAHFIRPELLGILVFVQ